LPQNHPNFNPIIQLRQLEIGEKLPKLCGDLQLHFSIVQERCLHHRYHGAARDQTSKKKSQIEKFPQLRPDKYTRPREKQASGKVDLF
jgi:hypothetical protein